MKNLVNILSKYAEVKIFFSNSSMKTIVILFFLIYFVVGSFLFKDYGVTTDEVYQIDKARITLDYVFGRSNELLTYPDRHYGAIFPIILDGSKNILSDSRDVFLYRHFITFSFFYLSTILFYKLLRKLDYNRFLSLLGTILLVVHPHIFAHSFFNPKDIPFLSMWILTLFSLTNFIKQPKISTVTLHGVATGLLVVFRLPGVLMWGITGLIIIYLFISKQLLFRKAFVTFTVFLVSSFATLYIFLPILWANPIGEFISFLSMDPFVWGGKELFMGSFFEVGELPWYHLIVYIVVTMPLVLLFLFVVGNMISFNTIVFGRKNTKMDVKNRLAIIWISFYFSIIVLLISRAEVYNGWRHVLFLYPMILLFVLEGLVGIWNLDLGHLAPSKLPIIRLVKVGLVGFLIGQIALLIVFIAGSHPYEYTYYNWFTGRKLSNTRINFIMDYWGLSYREAFEAILAKDDSPSIIVTVDNIFSAKQNWSILPKKDRDRLRVEKYDSNVKEDYFVSIFGEYLPLERKNLKLVDTIYVRDAVINATYSKKNK
jgi:hypothetical protein